MVRTHESTGPHGVTATVRGREEPTRPARSSRQMLLAFAFDLVAPIALYYGLRSAGVGVFLALIIGAVAPGLSAAVNFIRGRRVDGLGMSVMALLLLSVGVSFISGSPRFLLAKDGWFTAIWGAWFFVSLRGKRPLTFVFSRPLLEGRKVFDPTVRKWVAPVGESWDTLWERVPQFRRVWQVSTVIWGAATLGDAAIRVLMAYMLPVDLVPGLGGALWPVTFVVLQVITNVYFYRARLWSILSGAPDPAAT